MDKITIEEGIKINGYHLATIVGDSMMPLLRNRRDMVKIVPVTGVLKKDDLPLYKRPTGKYVLHRIIKVKKGYYITRGDNRFFKEKVPFEWIIGVTQSIYRDDMEIPVENPDYVAYIKNVRRTFWPRRVKFEVKKLLGKK